MKNYLFVLGRNFELSRAELLNFCDEVFSCEEKSLFIGENLDFSNPRELPKAPEQLFLDRLGGTIRFGEVLGEFSSKTAVLKEMDAQLRKQEKHKVGMSVFGGGKELLGDLAYGLRDKWKAQGEKLRVENFQGKNMTSGQIFDRRILQKGIEFLVWKNKDSFLLAQTVANQNIRNYTLRDRAKSFRDAHMGMLPPKLAQILINLANPKMDQTVHDLFCGSGTLNIEAAIMGYKTAGSDINESYVKGAKTNFAEMAQKFRYPEDSGTFKVQDVTQVNMQNLSGVVCTEGYLGENFRSAPTLEMIQNNGRRVLDMWKQFLSQLENSKIERIVFCLPCWNHKGKKISISEKLFAKTSKSSYILSALFENQKTFVYERDKTFVAREICMIERKKS